MLPQHHPMLFKSRQVLNTIHIFANFVGNISFGHLCTTLINLTRCCKPIITDKNINLRFYCLVLNLTFLEIPNKDKIFSRFTYFAEKFFIISSEKRRSGSFRSTSGSDLLGWLQWLQLDALQSISDWGWRYNCTCNCKKSSNKQRSKNLSSYKISFCEIL